MLRAIVFDFDGLILDTETPELTVWTQIFKENGAEMPSGYWSTIIGRGAEQEIERPPQLLERLSETFHETEEGKKVRVRRIHELIDKEVARPGVVDLLDEANQKGIPIGVASSSKHIWVDRFLNRLGLFSRFQTIVCADDVERAKPFPDLYLLACQRLDAEPANSIALEDSPNGIAAAKAAGLLTIAVTNPVTEHLNLREANEILSTLQGVNVSRLGELMMAARTPTSP